MYRLVNKDQITDVYAVDDNEKAQIVSDAVNESFLNPELEPENENDYSWLEIPE